MPLNETYLLCVELVNSNLPRAFFFLVLNVYNEPALKNVFPVLILNISCHW